MYVCINPLPNKCLSQQHAAINEGCRWFNHWLGQYSFQGLMIIIATECILSGCCPWFGPWLCGKEADGFRRISCRILVKRNSGKAWIYALGEWCKWKNALNGIEHHMVKQSRASTVKRNLFQTMWEKEEMLVSSIFSISHIVFCPVRDKFCPFQLPLINCFPNDKILDWSKLKVFADNKIKLNEKLKLVLGRVEILVTGIFSFSHSF